MANFNEKINSHKEFALRDIDSKYFIERIGSMKRFERNIYDDLYLLTNTYRLFIQYKTTHRVKKLAGRCFLWDNSHGDNMADPGNGIELRSLNDASQDDCEGFCRPRFDAVSAAVFITDQCVFMYGDVQSEADDISKDKEHVICTVSLCGSIVSNFRIPAEVFDRLFGLKENFTEQYEKRVKTENGLIEKAKRNVELYIDSLCSTRQKVEQAAGLIQGALIDIEEKKRALNIILSELNNTFYKLRI